MSDDLKHKVCIVVIVVLGLALCFVLLTTPRSDRMANERAWRKMAASLIDASGELVPSVQMTGEGYPRQVRVLEHFERIVDCDVLLGRQGLTFIDGVSWHAVRLRPGATVEELILASLSRDYVLKKIVGNWWLVVRD
jgi:hypothetical protein